MRVTLTEARPFAASAAPSPTEGQGRLLIKLIDVGKGSSGVYTPATLQAAAEAKVFPAGTHMYADHPSESETWERPERSIRDLAAVLIEDARFDAGMQALVAESRVYSAWRQPIADMAEDIGVSIRAMAESERGEWEGQPATIITRITEALSVDFVTHAGRGGKVLQILESARRRIDEATANDRRAQLERIVRDAYGEEKSWTWVRDYDDAAAVVWFSIESPDDVAIYSQGYELSDDVATALTGERAEVRVVTSYVPVSAPAVEAASDPTSPAGQSIADESSGGHMATTQIEESRLAQLETDAGRAAVLESERDEARRELAEHKTRATLRPVVSQVITASETIPALMAADTIDQVVEALAADATEDTAKAAAEAARTKAETYVAQIAESLGAGTPRGLGGSHNPGAGGGESVSEADVNRAAARAFGHEIKEA